MELLKFPVMSIKSMSLAAMSASIFVSAAFAQGDDIVPAKVQSDEQISVWVNNASLEMFVAQLASITGRQVVLEGDLEGQVSGKFNGSMVQTLETVGKQFPVLFDLDEKTLGAVAESHRSSATVALGAAMIDESVMASLTADLLPGNEVRVRNEEVLASGHPAFVKRIARQITSVLADTESISVAGDGAQQLPLPDIAESAEAEAQVTVVDAAAKVMVEEAGADATSTRSQSATAGVKASEDLHRPILWVTDIPGYDTF